MKVLVISTIALFLSGCGALDRTAANLSGKPSEVCVSGVTYLQFTSGVALKVDREGKPIQC